MIRSLVTVYSYQGKFNLTYEEKEILINAIKDYIYACNRHYDVDGMAFAIGLKCKVEKNIKLKKIR